MARKRKIKRKRMTVTEMYNRYAVGLQYYGESLATKKRATHKQLKEIKKYTSQLRKQLKEQGIENPPTIAQAYKLIKEQELANLNKMLDKPFADELEPLDYAEEPLDMTKFEYPILEEFNTVMEDVANESLARFGMSKPSEAIVKSTQVLEELVAQIEDNPEKKKAFADYLSKSDDFANLKQSRYYDYDEIINFLDALHDNILAIINDFENKNNQQKSPTFIAPTTIHFDI